MIALAPYSSAGSVKMGATLVPTAPGDEVAALAGLEDLDADTVVLVGERASLVPGLLGAVVDLADKGVRWAWIPRRAGELAALEAGCLPNLLPASRTVQDAAARVDLQAAWNVERLPDAAGLDAEAMIAAAASGELKALVTGAVELRDWADPTGAAAALAGDVFVVSLEQRASDVTELADVVFPVALLEEQSGTFLNWEHRESPVAVINTKPTHTMTDVRVLAALADAMASDLGMRTPAQARAAIDEIRDWEGTKASFERSAVVKREAGEGLLLATWREALDDTRSLDGAETLKATARKPVIRVSPATAAELGLAEGDVASLAGEVALPVVIADDMVDGVAWAPMNSGVPLLGTLQARSGDRVALVVDNSAGGVA